MNARTSDPAFDRVDQSYALSVALPPPEQIHATANAEGDGAKAFAENYANALLAEELETAKANAAVAERRVQAADDDLAACESELSGAPKLQHFLLEWPDYGHRQPWVQRLYNLLRILVALLGPAIGGGFLIANMMDGSFTMAEKPVLAVLAAGMIAVGSMGMSSWATAPTTDFRKIEARANRLLVFGMIAFGLWALFMAIKFGALVGVGSGTPSLKLTSGSGGVADFAKRLLAWLNGPGASVLSLGLHIFGDAMISAGIVSSAICSMRKTRQVKTEYTQHHTFLSEEYAALDERLSVALAAKADADARMKAAYAKRDAARELTLQIIQSKKDANAARRDSAIAAIHAELQGE